MVTDVGHAQRVITRTRDAESSGGVFTEIGLVTWRSLVKLTRTPVLLFFSLFMPLIWLVMFSQTFGTVFSAAATQLPYDYVAVLLPGITVMTAIQSASQSGFGMVADLESGFMDKFFVAPIRRSSVLAGKLLADGLRMAAQAGIILGIAAILTLFGQGRGWRIPFATGAVGAVLIMLLAAAFGVAFSGLSNTVALRTKNTETTMMVSFSLTFPLLFLSTALLPKGSLPPWIQTFSTVNPVSYMADAARALILSGYDWTALGNAFLAILAFGVVLNGLAIMAFRAQGK